MHIGTICTRQVATCTPNTSALQVATLMRNAHVGDLVVVEHRDGDPVPIGVVTDRDLVVEVMAKEIDPTSVTARDVMSRGRCLACRQEAIYRGAEA